MQKIVTHLWFDKEAVEATKFYVSLFKDSQVNNISTITGTPSGDTDIVSFQLAGQDFMAISAGPIFKFNPSISLFVVFDNEKEMEEVWNKLIDGGKALMEYDTYPWARKYGWLQDRYGLTWQLMWNDQLLNKQKITPILMFTREKSGMAKNAIEKYTNIFPNSKIEMMVLYEKGEGDKEGYIKQSRFKLGDFSMGAMDSSGPHEFGFNEAISFIIRCDDQKEIDYYWEKLSAVPEAEQCGWLKDEYGVSWQVVPTEMDKMMSEGSKEQVGRVTDAFLKMKKFDIKELQQAYEG